MCLSGQISNLTRLAPSTRRNTYLFLRACRQGWGLNGLHKTQLGRLSTTRRVSTLLLCAGLSCVLSQFHERVQLDSITHNELGDPDVLAHVPAYAPGAAAGPIGEHRGSHTPCRSELPHTLLPA